jgi:pyruvate dehydrogenase E2 component (dihydrolipoamide acetyltransferase)
MRQQIARVTVRSKREKPHFYVAVDVDMTRSMALRQEINQALAGDGIRVTVNDLIIRACIAALKEYPKFNAYYQDDGIRMNDTINVGLAVASDEGLIVPAILDCGEKSLKELAEASKDLANRASQGTLNSQEYSGGTFAISNLGMFGVASFTAIIQPPQTAVLAVGAVGQQPVVRDGQVAVAEVMTATLSADHRIVDGAEGAQFLNEVKRLLESPLSMLL